MESIVKAAEPGSTCACGGHETKKTSSPGHPSNILAMGQVDVQFSQLSVEKEFLHAASMIDTTGLTDRQVQYLILNKPENRYLADLLVWTLVIAGIEKYVLVPKNKDDLKLLLGTLSPKPDTGRLVAVIGTKGPRSNPDTFNGLSLPTVYFDTIYVFTRESLIDSIPIPDKPPVDFSAIAAEVFERVLRIAQNDGASDESRAKNFLILRDRSLYLLAADCYARDLALTEVDAYPWPLAQHRALVEVCFRFTNRKTRFVEKYCAVVDVHERFAFLVSDLAPHL
jgi:hypothetical protein